MDHARRRRALSRMASSARPFFSVLVTTYNRADHVERCVRSCLHQTFEDREIVVVDDASTDATPAVLAALDEPSLRVVRHERNRGTAPSRATAVDHARGEWIVMVDSDDEILPHALDRLRVVIEELASGVHVIRSRHRSDDGRVVPDIMPAGVTDYQGRLAWLEASALEAQSSDAGHCIHRSVFEKTNYYRDRRGAVEALWELDLARSERSLWVFDILGLIHTDAPNGYSRNAGTTQIVARVLGDAPDQFWMAETMLERHGAELARFAPHYRRWLVEFAAAQAFLAGDRRAGIRHSRQALKAGGARPRIAATLVLGTAGPRALAGAKAVVRGWRGWRGRSAGRGQLS